MRSYAIITLICLFVSQCAPATGHSASASGSRPTANSDSVYADFDDSVMMASLPSLADIPALPTSITIGTPSEASLQKPVKKYPEFKGGDKGLDQWFADHLQYPREAYERNLRKWSDLCIHITAKGTVDKISKARNDDYTLADTIAWGLIGQMPRWQPALDDKSRPTDFWYYLSVNIDHPVLALRDRQKWQKYHEENPGILYEPANCRQQPEFPGGEIQMYDWIKKQIVYTPDMDSVSGRVTTQFIVDRQGFIKDVEIVRGRHPALDAQALSIVKNFPRWIPAYDYPQTKDITYILPVTFKQ